MPTGRAFIAGDVVNGILYVLGGDNSTGIVAIVEAYDPLTDTWTTASPMPTARTALAAAVVNGVLYAVGGAGGGPYLATNEAFTPFAAPQPAGYWKTNEAATTDLLPVMLGNYRVDSFPNAQNVFKKMNCSIKSNNDAVGCLAGQLLAAKLNVENDADPCINSTIASADAFLISVGYIGPSGTYTLTKAERQSAIDLKTLLANYNTGLGCAP